MSAPRMRLKRIRDTDELDYPSQPRISNNQSQPSNQSRNQSNNRSRQQQQDDDDDDEDDGEHEIIFERPNQLVAKSNNQANDGDAAESDEGNLTDDDDFSASQELNPVNLSPKIMEFIKPVTSRIKVEYKERVAANADQTTEARRALGAVYKQLHDITRSDVDIVDNDEGISRGLQLTNELNRRTAHVTEELQDAEELSVLTEKGITKAKKKLSHGPLIDYKIYCSAFYHKYARQIETGSEGTTEASEIDWVAAGFEARAFGSLPPLGGATVTSFDLFGVHPVKQRSVTVRREKDELKHATPAQGNKLALESSQTDERVKDLTALFKKVTRNGPVPFWSFLVDPYSFVGTVENVFDFSFIVKDHCRMTWHEQDENRLFPLIQYKESNVTDAHASQSQSNNQSNNQSNKSFRSKREASAEDRMAHCTVTLDHDRWRGLIEAFDIKQPMIPSRYGGRRISQSSSQSSSQANKRRQSRVSSSQQNDDNEEEEDEEDNEVENDEEEEEDD